MVQPLAMVCLDGHDEGKSPEFQISTYGDYKVRKSQLMQGRQEMLVGIKHTYEAALKVLRLV